MAEEIGLHNLKPAPGSRHRPKRVGRGEGSGVGKTSGRGQKGAGARSGDKSRPGAEGGQMPIHMRLRKLHVDRHLAALRSEEHTSELQSR